MSHSLSIGVPMVPCNVQGYPPIGCDYQPPHLVIPQVQRRNLSLPLHVPKSPTRFSVLQSTMNTPISPRAAAYDEKIASATSEVQCDGARRPPAIYSYSAPVVSTTHSSLTGSIKTLIDSTVAECTYLLSSEIDQLRVEYAKLESENRALERQFVKLRYERDIAMSRLRMLSGRIVGHNQGFQSFNLKRRIDDVEKEDGETDMAESMRVCKPRTTAMTGNLPSPSLSRTASPFVPMGDLDDSDTESDDEVERYTLVYPEPVPSSTCAEPAQPSSGCPTKGKGVASRCALPREPPSFKARRTSQTLLPPPSTQIDTPSKS